MDLNVFQNLLFFRYHFRFGLVCSPVFMLSRKSKHWKVRFSSCSIRCERLVNPALGSNAAPVCVWYYCFNDWMIGWCMQTLTLYWHSSDEQVGNAVILSSELIFILAWSGLSSLRYQRSSGRCVLSNMRRAQ